MDNHMPTCKRFCREYGHQCSAITKTATAIVVALLWSTTVTSLMKTIFAAFYPAYTQRSYWLGLFLTSIFVLLLIPAIIFKYEKPHDMWAVLLLIEILGHMWGFKVKDLVTYGAYATHYLTSVFEDIAHAETYSFCHLVNPELSTGDFVIDSVKAEAQGFVGYNLDWGNYTHNRTGVFDGLYPYPYANNTSAYPAPGSHRRHLAESAAMPSPAPYAGPPFDVHHDDAHQIGPGQVCAFEYKTMATIAGFRVEKNPRPEYWMELGWVGTVRRRRCMCHAHTPSVRRGSCW